MEWRDQGIVIGTRKHGETSLIVEVMTRHHGRHLGLVRGGRSRKKQPFLQPGNSVDAAWRARLDEHLGTWQLEPTELRAARLMETRTGLFAIQTLAAHLRLLPEREAHIHLYEALEVVLSHLEEPSIAAILLVRFELAILDDMGFGLDLARCAATGSSDNLTHVSPKSGRAVSFDAAQPWLDKLLNLPNFLQPKYRQTEANNSQPDIDDINAGFVLTGHFFQRNVYEPRGTRPPDERAGFVKSVIREMENSGDRH